MANPPNTVINNLTGKTEKRCASLNKFVIPSSILPIGLKPKSMMVTGSSNIANGSIGGNTSLSSAGIGFGSGGVSHRKSPSTNLTSSGLQEKGLIVSDRKAIFEMNNMNNYVASSNSFRVKISPISSAKLPPKLPLMKKI